MYSPFDKLPQKSEICTRAKVSFDEFTGTCRGLFGSYRSDEKDALLYLFCFLLSFCFTPMTVLLLLTTAWFSVFAGFQTSKYYTKNSDEVVLPVALCTSSLVSWFLFGIFYWLPLVLIEWLMILTIVNIATVKEWLSKIKDKCLLTRCTVDQVEKEE